VSLALEAVDLNHQFDNLVRFDENLLRTNDLSTTVGDARKIEKEIGWVSKTPFKTLISEMVEYDLAFHSASH
jgi:GDP-D-mannose dehydratase